jgi:putative membrane protein
VKTLLKNQGVYNGLLGVLILLAVFCFASLAMTAVLMVYIILVAAYGAVSSQPRILLMQGGLPILTLIFLLLTLA